jgi:NADPH:quinone reductase-like Zn-dependent oxidoreductase
MATMKAWQFTSVAGGLEKNLFQPAAGAPKPRINDDQVLVEVYSMALNPADYKVVELGLLKAIVPSPAIPGMDFCGRVAQTGNKVDSFRVGEMVLGALTGSLGHGSLAQYVAASKNALVAMPDGLQIDDAASVGVAATTAYQALKPNVKEGDKVFINGGSGGTGIWTIQIAKALGCHVTTSCSSANIDLCKSLGADEVLDYKATPDVIHQLSSKGQIFNLTVDNVGIPSNLYKASNLFLVPNGKFVQVGMPIGLGPLGQVASNFLLPGFLGGGKRKYSMLIVKPNADDFSQLAVWMKEGKIRAVIDSTFEWDDAPKGFEKLKTGRAKGKIVVKVKKE